MTPKVNTFFGSLLITIFQKQDYLKMKKLTGYQTAYGLTTNNYDPECGIESPQQCVSPQCPARLRDQLSSLLPSRYGHVPARSAPVAASLAPATAPHPTTAHSRPVSAEYSSANWQISAAKPPSPTPLHCVQS